jgi:hypothetical protein
VYFTQNLNTLWVCRYDNYPNQLQGVLKVERSFIEQLRLKGDRTRRIKKLFDIRDNFLVAYHSSTSVSIVYFCSSQVASPTQRARVAFPTPNTTVQSFNRNIHHCYITITGLKTLPHLNNILLLLHNTVMYIILFIWRESSQKDVRATSLA